MAELTEYGLETLQNTCWFCGEQDVDEDHECEPMKEYVPVKPLPLDTQNAECHNCGYAFDEAEWDTRHIDPPQSVGESWVYTCPQCEKEVFEAGI